MTTLHVSCAFDGGAIEVLSQQDPANIMLNIRRDNASDLAQWFYFSVQGAAGQCLCLHFMNAGQCAYPEGWVGYQVVASYDRRHWFRIETAFDGAVMTARITPDTNCLYLAYFEPYSWEQHLDLLGRVSASAHVQLAHLGLTLQGRDMTLLRITDAHAALPQARRRTVWLIARQHPGETMAEWFVEGFLQRLLDSDDPVARALRERCVFYVVPNMNPDGSVRGNLRTNAAGVNLNRAWQAPDMAQSPEVFLVRQKMLQTGVDLSLDVHGDEVLPYNFVAGTEGNPTYSERVAALEDAFKASWLATCPDFQVRQGYARSAPGSANPSLATHWVGQQFDCLAFTIEMPFKDNADLPDARCGWSGARARQFGAGVLLPILAVASDLRAP